MYFDVLIDFRPEEQLQLVEREEIDDEEDLFEAIDKRNFHFLFRCQIVIVILFQLIRSVKAAHCLNSKIRIGFTA